MHFSDGRPDAPSDELLAAYLGGECTAAEREAIEQWMRADPDHAEYVEELQSAVDAAVLPHVEGDLPTFLTRLREEVRATAAPHSAEERLLPRRSATKQPRLQVRTQNHRWLWPAATIAVLTVVMVPALSHRVQPTRVATDNYRTVLTKPGERARLQLSDGSKVFLSVASRVRYPTAFSKTRTVELDGEAQFDIQPGQAPFIVNVGGTVVRVLGTSFVARHYPGEQSRIIVRDGRVSVVSSVLGAGEGVRVGSDGRVVSLTRREVTAGLAWTSGRLLFDRTPVRDVLTELSRWYGVEFRGLPADVLDYHVTLAFQGETVTPETLEALSLALGHKATRAGRTITFVPLESNE